MKLHFKIICHVLIKIILVTLLYCDIVIAEPHRNIYKNYNYYSISNSCILHDPFEKFNRKIFAFNMAVDKILLKPAAVIYQKTTNEYIKDRIASFISNIINEPITAVSYVIQRDGESAVKTFWRFLINSTFGIAGIFDLASKIGLPRASQDLGSAFARYGASPGPYVVLPLFGGTSLRDSINIISNEYINPLNYYLPNNFKRGVLVTKLVSTREKILQMTNFLDKNSSDYYIAMRSATHQNRESKIQYPLNFKCQ